MHMLMSVDSLLFIPVAQGDAFFNHSACKSEACLEEENKTATQQLAGFYVERLKQEASDNLAFISTLWITYPKMVISLL